MNRGETADIAPTITDEVFMSWNYAFKPNPKLVVYSSVSWHDDAFLASVGPGFYWRPHQYIRPFGFDSKMGFCTLYHPIISGVV